MLILLAIFVHYKPYALFTTWPILYLAHNTAIFSTSSGILGAKQEVVERTHNI